MKPGSGTTMLLVREDVISVIHGGRQVGIYWITCQQKGSEFLCFIRESSTDSAKQTVYQIRCQILWYLFRVCTVLSLVQFLDTSTGSKMDFFQFQDQFGKELMCPNTYTLHKYSNHFQPHNPKHYTIDAFYLG